LDSEGGRDSSLERVQFKYANFNRVQYKFLR